MIYELLPFMDIGNHAFFTVPAGARNRQIWSWIETNSIFSFRVDDNQLDIQPAMQRTLIRFGLLFRMLWQRRKKGVLIYMAVLWGRLSLFWGDKNLRADSYAHAHRCFYLPLSSSRWHSATSIAFTSWSYHRLYHALFWDHHSHRLYSFYESEQLVRHTNKYLLS